MYIIEAMHLLSLYVVFFCLRLSVQQIGATDMSKPAIWIDAGMHAREWIAPATALHIINKVSLYSAANICLILQVTTF